MGKKAKPNDVILLSLKRSSCVVTVEGAQESNHSSMCRDPLAQLEHVQGWT